MMVRQERGTTERTTKVHFPAQTITNFFWWGPGGHFAIYFALLIRGHFQSSKAMMQILSFVQHAGVKQERAGEASVQRGDG